MTITNISVATMTWARDAAEEKLLRESLQELAKLGLPVFITDGGSGRDFLDFLQSFSNFNLSTSIAPGVWPQVHNSLTAAYNAGTANIFYTEPDKREFFKQGLSEMLQYLQADEPRGIVAAARSSTGFASFPAFQKMTETTINNCCIEVTGCAIDYTYGPFSMNRLIVPHLDGLKDSIGWGWRPYAFIMARQLGFNIDAFVGDYFCPPEQQEDNAAERIYRMRQLNQNIEAIILSQG